MTATRRSFTLGIAGAALALPALAQGSRAVSIVVAFPPGGETDVLARIYAERLAPRIGRNVVVENRSGASGTIGAVYVSRAAPDGDTLLFAPNTFAIAPHVMRAQQPYDPVADFTPIIQTGTNALILMASRQSGLRSLADVVAQAKAGRVGNYGSPGSGSPMNVLGELFNRTAGISLAEVAYRGTAPLVADLLAGVVPVGFVTPAVVTEHVRAGTITPIAVSSRDRAALVPDVPTFIESGFDVEVTAWYGLFGPRGMQAAQTEALNTQMNAILAMPEVRERMLGMGIAPAGGTAAQFAALVRAESERYGRLVREFNISAG
ncbi:tripartite tricarboxylate transporter substrate binding protein [Roseomonas sp. AR75]|uniref:Bug family tripartite tricarboxylate transporter substrate binding protein n=1 Tax=Roseomonas sp. AR75 TaxID=2562311 RepID=UPI0010C1312A|nr:tripartite tricarboxylate transporter substrate-binding protein [Roseomonas sp. AR75]